MAVKAPKTTSTAADATTGIGMSIENHSEPATASMSGAPNVLEILSKMNSISTLNAEASDYVANITRIFNEAKAGITVKPVKTDKIEAISIVQDSTKYGVAILFAESHRNTLDNSPAACRNVDVIKQINAIDPSVHIVQCMVIDKPDYPKYKQMAATCCNVFNTIGSGPATNLTIDSMKNTKFSIITNIDQIRNFVDDVSPHACRQRDDIGILVCVDIKTKSPFTGLDTVEQKPLLAVTGYTRMMNPQDMSSGIKFVPVATITDVVSAIPNRNLLAMALPIAADAFINQALWTRPYQSFQTGKPNLGNLLADPNTKKPMFCDTAESFHAFVRTYMTAAWLAIDITEGRARPLGIDAFVSRKNDFLNGIYEFLKLDNNQRPAVDPVIMYFMNYTGSYLDNGKVQDTRCVDYLSLATKITDHRQIDHFLLQPNMPNVVLDNIKNIYDNTKSLYATTTIVLNSNIVSVMSEALRMNKINLTYDMPQNGNFNINQFLTIQGANNYAPLATAQYGFGRQGFLPGFGGDPYNL